MKGIVAETNGKYAIVLTKDGLFKKIKAEPYMTVGSEVDTDNPKQNGIRQKIITRAASIAAAALLMLGTGYGVVTYSMPYSYVDFDINPSIELTVNMYDRIIGAEALNSDGQVLLEKSNLKNSKLSEGVSKLISVAYEQGYIKSDDTHPDEVQNTVLFTVASSNANKSKVLKEELANTIEEKLSKESIISDVLVGEATLEQREDARKIGTTPGKLALIENAIEAEPGLSIEELKSAAVKDLVKKVKEKAKENKASKGNKETGKKGSTEDKKAVSGSKAAQPAARNENKGEKIVLGDKGFVSGSNHKANDNNGNKSGKPNPGAAVTGSKAGENRQDNDRNDKKDSNNRNNNSSKNNNISNTGKNNNNGKNSSKAGGTAQNSRDNNNKSNSNKNNSVINNNPKSQKPSKNEDKLERDRQKLREDLLKQIYKNAKLESEENRQKNNTKQNQQSKGNVKSSNKKK